MRRFILFLCLLWAFPLASQPLPPGPPGQKDSSSGTIEPQYRGELLLIKLRKLYAYTATSGKNYDNSRDRMFGWVDNIDGMVECLYTGWTTEIDTTSETTPRQQVFLEGSGINAEHLWPQSKFNEAGPMVYDLYHILPSRVLPNGDRADYPFLPVAVGDVTWWYKDADRLITAPDEEERHLYSRFKNTVPRYFEPRDEYKGDIARALFYFWGIYKSHAQVNTSHNRAFFEEMKATLYAWHKQDPPDAREQERSNRIELWQGNRNPFIDDTTLVRRAFFESNWTWTGDEGWRMAAAHPSMTWQQLYGNFWMQGSTGSNAPSGNPSLYEYNPATASFSSIASMSSTISSGKGHIVYLFEDDDFGTEGIQGGFPKRVHASVGTMPEELNIPFIGVDNNANTTIESDEGWMLWGNSFGVPISVDKLFTTLNNRFPDKLNQHIYVWNPNKEGGAAYETYASNSGQILAPYQAGFLKFIAPQALTDELINVRDIEALELASLMKSAPEQPLIQVHVEGNTRIESITWWHNEQAEHDLDSFDAYHLHPLTAVPFTLSSTIPEADGRFVRQYFNLHNEASFTSQIIVDVLSSGSYTISYQLSEAFQGYQFQITDEQGTLVPSDGSLSFSAQLKTPAEQSWKPNLESATQSSVQKVFTLHATPIVTSLDRNPHATVPAAISLNSVYPNPFNPNTSISFTLSTPSVVDFTVHDILGRRIHAENGRSFQSGTHHIKVDASRWSSGVYFFQLQTVHAVVQGKFTLLK